MLSEQKKLPKQPHHPVNPIFPLALLLLAYLHFNGKFQGLITSNK